jgi:hypothetical protein
MKIAGSGSSQIKTDLQAINLSGMPYLKPILMHCGAPPEHEVSFEINDLEKSSTTANNVRCAGAL